MPFMTGGIKFNVDREGDVGVVRDLNKSLNKKGVRE